MILRPGTKLSSQCCPAEVVVVRAPSGPVDLSCGGHPMVAAAEAGERNKEPSTDIANRAVMGKRYVSVDGELEVLCTKGGEGALVAGGEFMEIKESKAVPSSD